MTDDQRHMIACRAEAAAGCMHIDMGPFTRVLANSAADVPGLLAEVERLQARLDGCHLFLQAARDCLPGLGAVVATFSARAGAKLETLADEAHRLLLDHQATCESVGAQPRT